MPIEPSVHRETESNPEGLIRSEGRMAELIRTHNWSSTPLGSIEGWPEALLLSANLMLSCAFPSLVFWDTRLKYSSGSSVREPSAAADRIITFSQESFRLKQRTATGSDKESQCKNAHWEKAGSRFQHSALDAWG